MRKINTNEMSEETWTSPTGRYVMASKGISEALGRQRDSLNLAERHPFDVEIQRIPPGTTATVFHAHSAQWEFYHIIAGTGAVRHDGGTDDVVGGDAFIFKPGEAHQLINTGADDLIVYVVADNPIGESTYYPDSDKWGVQSPHKRLIRSEPLDYWDGEE